MADELGRRIAELVQEAEANVTEAPKRTWYEATVGHPGFMTHRPKLPEQRLADLRRDYVLSRLAGEVQGSQEREMMRSNPGLYRAIEAYRGNNKELKHLSRDQLQSPHEYTGIVAPGGGLHTAGQWLQSGVGLARSGSDMLANTAGDATAYMLAGDEKPMYGGYVRTNRQAQEDAIKHFNTLTAPVQTALGVSDVPSGYSSWSQADTARKEMAKHEDWADLTGDSRAIGSMAEHAAARMPESEDMLLDYKVDDVIGLPATRFLGATMDNTLNLLPPPLKSISAAARGGKQLRAGWELSKEMLPAYGMLGYAMMQKPPREREPDDIERIRWDDLATGLRRAQ